MECAICYEKFFTPETKEECKKIYNEIVKNNDYNEIMKFYNLVITPNNNNTHTCSNPNCKCLICGDCWTKITHNGKDIMDATVDDMPSIYDYFTCPYCRNIDWKYYMNNVFNELQKKVLGEEEFKELFFKKCSSAIF
jgi:hypothetical protein